MHPIRISICCLILPVILPGQNSTESEWVDLPLRQATVIDPVERGIETSESGGKVVEVVIGSSNRVPFTRPVSDWRIAELPGSVFVILAGGIRESLDLYLYESETGAVQVIDTDGGRLLADDFAGGQGSWPSFEGRDLVFFPFERADKLQLSVVNFQGQVLATKVMPLEVDAYQVRIDRRSQQLRLSFPERSEELRFLHPSAGRLVLDTGLILFSGPERRSLMLSNEGRRPLSLDLVIEGEGYRLIGDQNMDLPAQSSRELSLEMLAEADAEARLSITSPVAGASALVGLQNMPALAKASANLPRTQAGKPAEDLSPVIEPSPGKDLAPPNSMGNGEPAVSDHARVEVEAPKSAKVSFADIEMRRLNGTSIEISGRLVPSPRTSDEPSVSLRNRVTGREKAAVPGADGRFELRMAATDAELIEYGLSLQGEAPRYQLLGPVLPVLRREAGILRARGDAASSLLLLEVSVRGEDGLPTRVLRSWRLRVDTAGLAEIPLAELGRLDAERSFLLLASSPEGSLSQSALVRIKN